MGKLSEVKTLISLFGVGCILLTALSMIGCATTPVDYKKSLVDRALTAKSKSADDYALIANNFYEKGQYDEAIKNAKQGIALNPNNAPSWYWLGVAYYNKGQYEEAIQPFKKVIELKPEGLLQSSYSFLGSTYLQKGNYDEAILSYNKALELNPNDINTLVDRGWSYYRKGNFNVAIKEFNRAIENIKPEEKTNLQSALRGKGFSYLGLRDGETAVNLIKQAKSVLDYDNNYDLTLIYYVMGNKEKAWEFRGGKGAVGLQVRDYKKGEINGANIVKIMSGGPAEKSAILTGDVIIKINNAQILNAADCARMLRALEPGTMARITVLREGMEREVVIKVAFADFQMESDQLIAPIIAKNKGDSGAKASRESVSFTHAKADVDELPVLSSPRINKNAYAIVIGIEQYRQKLPKADFAVNDALTVTNYLSKVMGYPEQNIITLTGEHAAKSDLEKYFEKWLWNNVEKDSTVFVYFSGHGAPNPQTGDAYLVPYDGDPSFIEQTGYSLKRLYESLNKLPAKEIIVALDSCFSGAGGRSVIAKGARPLVMNLQNSVVLSKNITVMSASSSEQISSTYDEKGHGLFTYFMLKGIKNEDVVKQDGSLAIGDLFSYLKPQVERIARKQYNNEQTPQLMGAKKN
ncbi:MAG: tetratricopeptide repeat protein [Proteobacteria bacterium]|nr:tetratricopeptide repeat protein [Pseudomonadota bacterium]